MLKICLFILMALFSSVSQSATYAGGLIINGETRLILTDTETGVCISIPPNDTLSWLTTSDGLLPVLNFAKNHGMEPRAGEVEREFCQSHGKYYVAKNRTYTTRPMRDENFNKTAHRISVGRECENKMIRPYSSTDTSRGYFFVTNEAEFRGLVVCNKGN